MRAARSRSQAVDASDSLMGVPAAAPPGVAKKLAALRRTGDGVRSAAPPPGRSGDGSSRSGVPGGAPALLPGAPALFTPFLCRGNDHGSET